MIFNPALLNVLSVLFLMFLGCFVYFSKKTRSNFAFLLLTFSAAVWQAGTYLTIIAENPETAFFWTKASYIGVTLIPVTMFQLVVEILGLKRLRKMVLLSYAVALFIYIPITWANIFLNGVYQFQWGYWFKATQYHPLYILSYSFLFFVNLLLLYFAAKKQSGPERTRIIYLLIALFVSYGGAIDYLTDYGINIYPSGYLFVVACLAIIAYAITKTRLMDISVIISKSIAYGMTMAILGVGYLLIVATYRAYVSPAIDIGLISVSIAYGIFVGFAFERLRMFIQTSSDKVFLKGRYDFTDTLTSISEGLSSIVSLKDFYDFLEKIRLDYIEASSLKVYIPGDQSQQIEHSLIEFLDRSKKIFHVSELPKDIAGSVNKARVELLAPCFAKGKLAAILFVGRKLSEDPYREEEIDVFKVLAPQIATVIERVKPYEKAKEDYVAAQILADSAQKAAERAQNMAILGQIALQAGHEIKNPIAAINIHTELLTKHIGDADHIGKYIELVKRNSKKIEDIIEKMKQFGAAKTEEKKPFDIAEMLSEKVLFLLEGHIKKKEIKVESNISGPVNIWGNEASLEKALVNIVLNAIEAMDTGGVLSLSAAAAGGCAEITIKDTGAGIPKENLEKIFLPMFTTRHEGTGLGLSIAYKIIVADHGGNIDIQSEPAKGTTVTVTLPL